MITFIGAGPGAGDLITLRGAERIAEAKVIIWAASLVPEALIAKCRPDAVIHDSKQMTLEEVCAVFEAHPDEAIARVHSGDTAIYSAIGEQIAWCRENDRCFEIVPGVTSASAAAAAAGCELTIPGVSQTLVMTRLARRTGASMPATETLAGAAAAGGTLALFLSTANVRDLAAELLEGDAAMPAETPVVVAHRVSWPEEQILRTTLGCLVETVEEAGFDATTLFLIGPALAAAEGVRRSHVYDGGYTTRFRAAVSTSSDG